MKKIILALLILSSCSGDSCVHRKCVPHTGVGVDPMTGHVVVVTSTVCICLDEEIK